MFICGGSPRPAPALWGEVAPPGRIELGIRQRRTSPKVPQRVHSESVQFITRSQYRSCSARAARQREVALTQRGLFEKDDYYNDVIFDPPLMNGGAVDVITSRNQHQNLSDDATGLLQLRWRSGNAVKSARRCWPTVVTRITAVAGADGRISGLTCWTSMAAGRGHSVICGGNLPLVDR